MEKQLALFIIEENDERSIWSNLPEKNRQKIERIFAKLLIENLCSSSKEAQGHES